MRQLFFFQVLPQKVSKKVSKKIHTSKFPFTCIILQLRNIPGLCLSLVIVHNMLCLSVGQHLSFHVSSRGRGLSLKPWREGHWFYSWGWWMGVVVTTVACILIERGQWRGLQWFYLILIIRDLVYTEIKEEIIWSKHILTLCRNTPLSQDFKERNEEMYHAR